MKTKESHPFAVVCKEYCETVQASTIRGIALFKTRPAAEVYRDDVRDDGGTAYIRDTTDHDIEIWGAIQCLS